MEHVAAAVLGLILGSFLNVVIARLPRKQSLSRPGSRCPGCKRPIRWYENIPVISYLALRGRCRGCRERISLRYPVVECLTALLFVAAERKFGWSPLLVARDFPWICLLVAIAFIDLDTRLIPNKLTYPGTVLGLATSYWVPDLGIVQSLAGAGLGFGFFFAFAWAYQRWSGRAGLGGGDIKFLAMAGAFLGPLGVFTTVLISSVFGSIIGIAWILIQRRKGQGMLKTSLPYGPFLVVGALYYSLLGDVLWLPFTIPT